MTQPTETDRSTEPGERAAALGIEGVSKYYPGVRALSDVTVHVRPGSVHGLVGENGAGKSTLMGVASGAVTPDTGRVLVGGETAAPGDPKWSREHGLAIVHQEPALLKDLTVAENMALVMPRALRPSIGRQQAWAAEQLAGWAEVARIDPRTLAGRLRPDERFVVEIARALASKPSVLILDEPTEHLVDTGVRILFEQIRRRASEGVAVVYISHRIREVLEISEEVSVLRNGELRGTRPTAEMSEDDLVSMIVGRQLGARFPEKAGDLDLAPALLEVEGLTGSTFAAVGLTVREGEILGLAGIEGQGQREFLRSLAGLESSSGEIRLRGERLQNRTPAGAGGKGIAYLSSDRAGEGVLTSLSVRRNLMLKALDRVSRLGMLSLRREREGSAGLIRDLEVKTPSDRTPIESLSGGNQQKVMMGRTLASDASLLLIDEPSQGVDVGARADIYGILRGATEQGRGAIVLSSDNSELEGLCDRVLVFSRGAIVREFTGDQVRERSITEAAITATGTREHRAAPRSNRMRQLLGSPRLLPWCVLVVALLVLGTMASFASPTYLTPLNFALSLPMLAVLIFAATGQQFAMLVGGIDLSVGPLISVVVVTASFVLAPTLGGTGLTTGVLILCAVAIAVGAINWVLISVIGVTPIIATLVTYTGLQGVALLIRPTPGGSFHRDVTIALQTSVGPVPVSVIVGIALVVLLEISLTRTRAGVMLRAAGSDPAVAGKIGVRVAGANLIAYVACAVAAMIAGLLFLPIAGSGNASVGTIYTLSSIAAVVLGGASIFGGRGSFVGAMLGAALVFQINLVVPFLGLTSYWQLFLLGALTLIATAAYSRLGTAGARGAKP